MDFAYGPPPPPPPPKNQGRGNSENRKNIQKKNETGVSLKDGSNTETHDMGLLGDLPTHLPNSKETSMVNSKEELSEDEEIVLKRKYQETQTKPKEPVFIPGTSITLETEEDINKWIEERKKKWPSRRNIEEKEKEKEKEKLNQSQVADNPKKRTSEPTGTQNIKKPKNLCKFYQNNKRCKFGNKCKNVHELASTNAPSQNVKTINNIKVAIPQRFKNEMYINEKESGAHPLLFKMLVQKDHFENENSKVLDFIQFLNEKGLIDHNVTI